MSEAARFRYLVLAAQREGNRLLTELLRPHGLTPAQAEVLSVLAGTPGITVQELGRRLVCESGSPSRLVSTVVSAGWVQRTPAAEDRRAVELSLTDAGAAAARAVAGCEAQLYELLEGRLGADHMAAANAVLEAALADTTAGEAIIRRGLARSDPESEPEGPRPGA